MLEERNRMDYEQTLSAWKLLTEIRFKLLALVPTVAGAAVGLLTTSELGRSEEAVLSLLGFSVTLGIVFYDQRNSQLYNATIGRATFLEGALKLKHAPEDAPDQGGLMRSRPADARNLFGRIAMRHDRALAIIYGGVLGSWMFPLFQAIVPSWQWIGLLVATAVGLLFVLELEYLGRPRKRVATLDLLDRTFRRLHQHPETRGG
jgi:hypothetical protein